MTGDAIDSRSRSTAIERMLRPRSIAVVGASAQLDKINGRPLKHLIDKGYAGRILPVNPKYREIAGIACHPSVQALPEAADMAVIAVPAQEVIANVRALGERGVRSAVIFSSGFGEMGAQGRRLEDELKRTARAAGVVLCGPNCLGFINAFDDVYATFSQYADGDTAAGPIAFVTQSGAFGTAIAALARQRGLGLGYFINTGNQADLTFAELMEAVVDDPRIRVAAGYLEGVEDGDALIRLAQRCHARGLPLVLTKVGRMASGARAAASHTGALAVPDAVFDAVIRQYGVLRARNEEQMLDMLEVFSQPRRAAGNGLGIATQSGGAGVMMADRAEEVGLAVPELGDRTRTALLKVMPAFGSAGNPVDITGQFVARPELLRESVVAMLDDPAIDIAIVWLQLMTAHVDALVEIFTSIRDRTTKPMLVCWVAAPADAVRRLRELGLIVYPAGERAVEAATALAQWGRFSRQIEAGQAAGVQRGADAAQAVAGTATQVGGAPQSAIGAAQMPADPLLGVQPGVQSGEAATRMLSDAGIPMAPVRLAADEAQAVAHWRAFGRPVALKIESPDITHKTEVGGVTLNLDDEAALRAAFGRLREAAARAMPAARIDGVLVQPMTAGHVELVMGVRRDPVFGTVVMVGSGGILVEVLKDVAFRRAPFAEDEALRMLAELRMAALLDGVRGRPAVDRRAVARMLSRLSHWADRMAPLLSELDLNPVLIGPEGPVAVDCVMVFDPRPPGGG